MSLRSIRSTKTITGPSRRCILARRSSPSLLGQSLKLGVHLVKDSSLAGFALHAAFGRAKRTHGCGMEAEEAEDAWRKNVTYTSQALIGWESHVTTCHIAASHRKGLQIDTCCLDPQVWIHASINSEASSYSRGPHRHKSIHVHSEASGPAQKCQIQYVHCTAC